MGRLQQPDSNQYSFLGGSRHFLDIPLANGLAPRNFSTSSSSTTFVPSAAWNLSTPTKEESTRVQLQEERLKSTTGSHLQQHHAAIVVSRRIPGFKTSAAFLASLRTNLRLNASPPPSPWSTPPSMRASTSSLPPPSPLSFITNDSTMEQNEGTIPEDPLAGVPELKTVQTDVHDEKITALALVQESIAEMRQTADSALARHPLNLAILMAMIAMLARYLLVEQKQPPMTAATTCTGFVMVVYVLGRWMTKPYVDLAEEMDVEWLGTTDVFVTKFGDEIIGTVLIDWVSDDTKQRRKKPRKAEIKAWTVRLKDRHKGVGTALLEAVVKEAKKRGAETIEFSDTHANSRRILPGLYNSKFEKDDRRAREILQELLDTNSPRGKKK